ncbi:MAG TPA: RIO1 family regulatory kinase/ATPase [Ilumatobacteraceae bacterium]|nr:RIO1 family regulatory kinase/ATPase [Ilumatobacteraceae bacterium]
MAARRSNRPRSRRFDDDGWEPDRTVERDPLDPTRDVAGGHDAIDDHTDEPAWSTYRDATKGPDPVPAWVVTDPRAIDTDLGVMKSGKEANVSLLRRELDVDGEPVHGCLAAVKRYRSAEHRMFHRDAGYLEGRRIRKSREMRAITTRTDFGKELIAQQWAIAEFAVLSRLWSAGAAVPYPIQLFGTEMMMEFIGSADGVAAPRLAHVRPTRTEGQSLYRQLAEALVAVADAGYAHGDLSAYNVLVHDGRLVLIDLPQAVDLVGNPQGFTYLRRDCDNICSWFVARGVPGVDANDLYDELIRRVPGLASH